VDIAATSGGEPVAGLTTDDFLYELGSGAVLPELDERLQGAAVGDILEFDAAFGGPDETVTLRVLVKDVKEKILPDVTDEWASDASEFDTVEELRADLVKRMSMVKRVQASMAMRNGAVEALVELVEVEVPEPLITAEMERRADELGQRLAQQGASIADYLQATGRSEADVVAELRASAEPSVKADLALRAVADAEGIEVSDEEIEREIERLAQVHSLSADQVRHNLEHNDQLGAVRSDVKKTKALEWLVEHVELVDPDGNPVDRTQLSTDAITKAIEDVEPTGAGSPGSEVEAGTVAAPLESGEA
jgi:trigger factor